MSSASVAGGDRKELPVFALPTSVYIYADEPNSHRAIVTIYNPYNFPVRYRVLSTNPDGYIVTDPDGPIRARHSRDLVVRHNDIVASTAQSSSSKTDLFRVHVYEDRGGGRAGAKIGNAEFSCHVSATRDDTAADARSSRSGVGEEEFRRTSGGDRAGSTQREWFAGGASSRDVSNDANDQRPSTVYIVIALICVLVLSLPDQDAMNVQIPRWLHTSENNRLVASYVLGLLTVVLLRT